MIAVDLGRKSTIQTKQDPRPIYMYSKDHSATVGHMYCAKLGGLGCCPFKGGGSVAVD